MKNFAVIAALVVLSACTTERRIIQESAPSPGATETENPAEVDDGDDDDDTTGEANTPKKPSTPAEKAERFGAKIKSTNEVALEKIVSSPSAYAKQTFVTSGVVRQNCQKRGCWMDVRPEEDRDGASVTVRFKDYGFFIPLSSRGAKVRMEGIVKVTTMSAEQVADMEAEGAIVPGKKEDGSAQIIEITANGVEMTGRKK